MTRPLRIAALVKQIPKFEQMSLGADGRLVRGGLELHMNDYCRRAVAKGVELAAGTGGSCTAITLGPPEAHTVLREAILGGCVGGVHVTDPAFAGSDTLATARALAAAIDLLGSFDLVLCGRNSLDADTGQVPPQLAELLGLPFATGARSIDLEGDTLRLRLEHDDEWVTAAVALPAIVSCAERLCDPCKIKDPDAWATVDAGLIRTVTADELGPGPWGQAASPTWVGTVRAVETNRARHLLTGDPDDLVRRAVALLETDTELGSDRAERPTATVSHPSPGVDGQVVAVLVEPHRPRVAQELLGAAAQLAATTGGRVAAVLTRPDGADAPPADLLGTWGADHLVWLEGPQVEEDIAHATAAWADGVDLAVVLAPGTAWGREVASRLSARMGAGLTGDAVGVETRDGRLVALKPAFGGALVAEIGCSSPVAMATVRPGVLALPEPRPPTPVSAVTVTAQPTSRLQVTGRYRDDDSDELARAEVVIGVGQGVDPGDYPLLESLRARLGATLCATRKVTDRGWMARARQVGITGHSIAPRLFVSVGSSGRYNHTVGIRRSGTVIGINPDPDAELWRHCDIGLVGDWREVLPALVDALAPRPAASA